MPSINIKNVLQTTLQSVEQSAELRENDPSLRELKATLIRTIAELEVAKLERAESAQPAAVAMQLEVPKEGDGSANAAVV
jgi:hypothetical protein